MRGDDASTRRPTVFLSYRREETQGSAGRIVDRLIDHLGEANVFMDVDKIEPGVDFVEAIITAIERSDVVLAVIGPRWTTIADRRGRRLDDPDDPVRLEIATALDREAQIIPVLVDGAVLPDRDDLPEPLRGLLRRHAVGLHHASFVLTSPT